MELDGKKVLVIGAGRSGVASARFLAARGALVVLNDRKEFIDWSNEALALKGEGVVKLLAGDVPSWLLDQIELVVVSPGVPTRGIPVRYAERAGAEVIGEIELAWRYLRGRVVGITGTNGKTTTTTLVGELLKDAGLPVQVGGNIGTPLVSLVDSSREDGWTVVELSSYQLETVKTFRPTVAVVLNLMPDHMDRYETFADYGAAKHRIFRNQTSADVAILNADDEVVSTWARGLEAHVTMFSTGRELDEGLFLRGRELVARTWSGERVLMSRDEMQLKGAHNVQNVLAALAAGLACGAGPESMPARTRPTRRWRRSSARRRARSSRSARTRSASRTSCRSSRPRREPRTWPTPCGARTRRPSPATRCCSPRPAPASTCSRASSTAGACSRRRWVS
ncbi:MAG: UDP-N-acetylmuramoyl-L-alanine--D-glutamate ligase [Acidobacteria bacterium]|nr:UDP-N-acetylmuramoyl-L-alanine--D-glutamate ligase [Acidobacteriota bacterium]